MSLKTNKTKSSGQTFEDWEKDKILADLNN